MQVQAPPFSVIVGLGKTGLSCAKHLQKQGHPFAVTDDRNYPPGLEEFQKHYPEAELSVGSFNQALMLRADELIVSQGVPFDKPEIIACKRKQIPIIGDIELFARHVSQPIVAITGSNAKSTVTSLVGHMAKTANVNVPTGGNLGTPALDLITENPPEGYILEVSNFQLETTYSLKADIACILNITPDHLDRYSCFADYCAAKQRIYHNCNKAVFNRDDPLTYIPSSNKVTQILSFGRSVPKADEFGLCKFKNQWYLAYGSMMLISVNKLMIVGQLNWLNALAALAIGSLMGLPLDAMLYALETFKGLPHRCEMVAEKSGVQWYNDSKGTNVGATLAAIEGIGEQISGKILLIAGGIGKNADFSLLVPAAKKYVKTIILLGQDKDKLAQAFQGQVNSIRFVTDLKQALFLANNEASRGDAIVLSPACASFDMFKNFEHRGEVFCQLVQELVNAQQ